MYDIIQTTRKWKTDIVQTISHLYLWKCYLRSTCGIFFLSFTNIVTGRVFCLQHGCCICCTWDFHEHVTTVEYNKANKVARQIIFFTSGLLNLFMEKYIDRNIVSPVFLLLVTICDTIWVFFFDLSVKNKSKVPL